MMKIGQVFKYRGGLFVVVMVNDCRAIIVPMGPRKMNDTDVSYREDESGAQSISPNSDMETLGFVAGTIIRRDPILIKAKNLALPDVRLDSNHNFKPKPVVVVQRNVVVPLPSTDSADLAKIAGKAAAKVFDHTIDPCQGKVG